MEEAYEVWKKKPTPENMGLLLEKAAPTIDSALRSYASGNPALKSRAKLLAVDAFKTYDPKKGAKISTHLMTQLQPLTRHARAYANVTKTPERVAMDLYRMNQSEQEFHNQQSRLPSDKELADHSGLSVRRLAKLRKYHLGEIAESGLTEMDEGDQSIMYPGVHQQDPNAIWLEYVHHDLAPLDQKILEWRTGFNGNPVLPNNEIAKRLKLSPGAVSQRAAKIATRLSEIQGVEGVV